MILYVEYMGGEGATEDEMVGWHHRLNGHDFEQAPGDSEGQGSLVCCSPVHKELDTTEHLNMHTHIWNICKGKEREILSHWPM